MNEALAGGNHQPKRFGKLRAVWKVDGASTLFECPKCQNEASLPANTHCRPTLSICHVNECNVQHELKAHHIEHHRYRPCTQLLRCQVHNQMLSHILWKTFMRHYRPANCATPNRFNVSFHRMIMIMSILSTEKTHYLEIELYTNITPAGRTTRLCCAPLSHPTWHFYAVVTLHLSCGCLQSSHVLFAAYANYGSAALAIILSKVI